jgi:tetratricopeptide (TPR) repeat protein
MNVTQINKAALEVLGPVFRVFLEETQLVGNADFVVMDNAFQRKDDVYARGIAALSLGEAGWDEAAHCFEALTKGAPDFAEGYFQAAALAKLRGQIATARTYSEEAIRLHPAHDAYVRLAAALRTSNGENQHRLVEPISASSRITSAS